MRTSIVIATHNEGPSLEKTIASVRETTNVSETEIVVLDDGSTDGSAAAVAARDASIRYQRYERRVGVARAKHDGALMASGDVLVFLDGHCKPETGAIDRLVEDVLLTQGEAIFTPRICPLDTATWENKPEQSGHGYVMRLDMMRTRWRDLEQMQLVTLEDGREVYETPNLQGCVLSLTRRLYDRLRGFDTGMQSWGVEDVDLGVKAWLMGHAVLHDPVPLVGHRYQERFDRYAVTPAHVLMNQMRLARKCLSEALWEEWLVRFGRKHDPNVWLESWAMFQQYRPSVEQERSYLLQNRVHDEFWYSRRFQLAWPVDAAAVHSSDPEEEPDPFTGAPDPSGSPSPSRRAAARTPVLGADPEEEPDPFTGAPDPSGSPSPSRRATARTPVLSVDPEEEPDPFTGAPDPSGSPSPSRRATARTPVMSSRD